MAWLRSIRRCNPGAPVRRILWWECLRMLMSLWMHLCYRYRAHGARKIPAEGPVLLVSNHQSYLDLIALGVAIRHRHFHAMARRTLFRGPLAWLIRSLNAFAVDQESKGDTKAMRTAIDLLKQGHLVLIFPEGSRTADGAVHPFQKGTSLLLRRAKPTIVPAAVEGIYDIWPIGAKRPRPFGRIDVRFGDPIPPEQWGAMDDVLAELRNRVDALRLESRARLRDRSRGTYPAAGPGDGLGGGSEASA